MTTTNMLLDVPTPEVTTGPEYTNDLVDVFDLVDAHDHTSNKGVKVPAAGININTDLEFNSNDATELRTSRYDNQSGTLSATDDKRCVYVVSGDLYYNNNLGNSVRLTNGSAIAISTIGAIGGDYTTTDADCSYSDANKYFTFTQDTNHAANLACGDIQMYEPVLNGKYIQWNAPTSLAANYNLTLMGALPASQKIVTIDASGNIASDYVVDDSTIEINSNTIRVKDDGIVTAKILDANVTEGKLATNAVTTNKIADANITNAKMATDSVDTSNIVDDSVTPSKLEDPTSLSSSCGTYTTSTSDSYEDVTNLTVTFTGTNRPMLFELVSDNSTSLSNIQTFAQTLGGIDDVLNRADIYLHNGSTQVDMIQLGSKHYTTTADITDSNIFYGPGTVKFFIADNGTGSQTYKIQVRFSSSDDTTAIQLNNIKLLSTVL